MYPNRIYRFIYRARPLKVCKPGAPLPPTATAGGHKKSVPSDVKVVVHHGREKAHSLLSTMSEQQQVLFERTIFQQKMVNTIGLQEDRVPLHEMARIIQPRPPAMPKTTSKEPLAHTDLRLPTATKM